MNIEAIATKLGKAKRISDGWSCLCPAHDDNDPSLSLTESHGKLLVHCHAGCSQNAVIEALKRRSLWKSKTNPVANQPAPHPTPNTAATPQRSSGLTVQQFAEAKKLSVEFLEQLGLRDINYSGRAAVEIPYRDDDREDDIAVRYRLSNDGPEKFRWKPGTKVCLYGLDRLRGAEEKGFIALVEGETDAITLWLKNWPAVGLPGASTWDEKQWIRLFDNFATVYVVIEPDRGGETMLSWIEKSELRERIRLIRLDGFKDPSEMYIDDPERFDERWQAALECGNFARGGRSAAAEAGAG